MKTQLLALFLLFGAFAHGEQKFVAIDPTNTASISALNNLLKDGWKIIFMSSSGAGSVQMSESWSASPQFKFITNIVLERPDQPKVLPTLEK